MDTYAKVSTVSNAERLQIRQLGTLTPGASAAALVDPARAQNVPWDPDAVRDAVDYADGFPYTLQLIGDQAWQATGRPDPWQPIAAPHVATARDRITADLRSQHEARWIKATPAQRRILRVMADLGGGHPVSRSQLVERLGTATRSISQLRDQLIADGIIESAARGELSFTATGFASTSKSTVPPAISRLTMQPNSATHSAGRPGTTDPIPLRTQTRDRDTWYWWERRWSRPAVNAARTTRAVTIRGAARSCKDRTGRHEPQ